MNGTRAGYRRSNRRPASLARAVTAGASQAAGPAAALQSTPGAARRQATAPVPSATLAVCQTSTESGP